MENEGSEQMGAGTAPTRSRPSRFDAVVGAAVPLVLLLFAVRIGSFPGGAESMSVWFAFALAAVFATAGAWRGGLDPLGFLEAQGAESRGRPGTWCLAISPFVLIGLVSMTRAISPVPRAGLLWPSALVLGLLTIPAVAWCLDRAARRAAARWAMAGSILVVSLWALVDWLGGSPRPAAPLGHHNLLAVWLVVLWPFALLPGRTTGRERVADRGASGSRHGPRIGPGRQVVDGAVLAASALTLLASRSLAGNLAFGLQLIWTAHSSAGPGRARRVTHFGLLGLAMVLAVGWRRLGSLLSGGVDQSFASRWDYAGAAWSGFLQRPFVGWGPGSSAWTLHLHLDGTRLAPGQVVTDAHALVLDLLYEWGLVAVLMGTVLGLWMRWWLAEESWPGSDDPGEDSRDGGWRATTITSLVGLAVLVSSAGFFDVTALWVLIPFVLGARLAVVRGLGSRAVASGPPGVPQRLLATAIVLLALLSVLAPLRAHRFQERARLASDRSDAVSASLLERAIALDPQHPQIGIEWSRWLADGQASDDSSAARSVEAALRAATTARALAPLHLEAGARYTDWSLVASDMAKVRELRSAALSALETACDLAPRDGLAPFLRATLEEPLEARPLLDYLIRGLLAEPRLLVTPELLARPDLRRAAVDRVAAMTQIPVGWRAALAEAEQNLPELPAPVVEARPLELVMDRIGETSLSLFAFRRAGKPTSVASVAVDASRLDFEIPPVFVLPEVRRHGVLPFEPDCRLKVGSDPPAPTVLAERSLREVGLRGRAAR